MGKTPQKNALEGLVENDLGIDIKVIFPDFGAPGRISTLIQCMQFNPSAYQRMLQHIRNGVFDVVAAESLGVHCTSFNGWMRKGRKEVEPILLEIQRREMEDEEGEETYEVSPYGKFFLEVRQASAQARAAVEVSVAKDRPDMWLRSGPPSRRDDLPSWAEETQRIITEDQTEPKEDYTRAPADAETLGAAFDVLVELGYITMTELGHETFGKPDIVQGRIESKEKTDDTERT